MTASRKIATIVGALFIAGDVAGVLSLLVTGPILGDPGYLAKVAASETQIVLAALFVLAMGLMLAMIPFLMFPIFKAYNEALAIGCVVFRGALESVTCIITALSWLLLLTLSQEYAKAGAVDASGFGTLGIVLLRASDWTSQIGAIVFSLGALMFYYLFYQSRLIPRWLSVWGLAGAVLYLAAPLSTMFGAALGFLMAPLALQELVLALWLIVKGFTPAAIPVGFTERVHEQIHEGRVAAQT